MSTVTEPATPADAKPIHVDDVLTSMGFRRAPNDQVYDWLKDLFKNVRRFLNAPQILPPLLNDPRLAEALKFQAAEGTLAQKLRELTELSRNYQQRFQAIHARHASRRGSSADQDDLVLAIDISQQYIAFTSDYQFNVYPVFLDIFEILDKAGLDTRTIRVEAGTGLVYDFTGARRPQ